MKIYKATPARGLLWAPKETRQARLSRAADRKAKERALTRLFEVFGLTDKMTRAEVKTEAYLAYKRGRITQKQARVLGCTIPAGR